ncbi:hypothetical protein LXL04_038162 [Taraxacum kok-saghyz]
MVVGGGGRILDHMSPLDLDFAIRRPHIGLYVTEIINRSLTYVHVCVVTKVEGNTSGDAATTTSQLRRSDRGRYINPIGFREEERTEERRKPYLCVAEVKSASDSDRGVVPKNGKKNNEEFSVIISHHFSLNI